eukprot:NODE_189_length_15604_cov_0.314802.p6 type:complete len:148 gc:universal NODE_189_length_15604_cov_0.314802:5612-5169(-)
MTIIITVDEIQLLDDHGILHHALKARYTLQISNNRCRHVMFDLTEPILNSISLQIVRHSVNHSITCSCHQISYCLTFMCSSIIKDKEVSPESVLSYGSMHKRNKTCLCHSTSIIELPVKYSRVGDGTNESVFREDLVIISLLNALIT